MRHYSTHFNRRCPKMLNMQIMAEQAGLAFQFYISRDISQSYSQSHVSTLFCVFLFISNVSCDYLITVITYFKTISGKNWLRLGCLFEFNPP